MKLKTLILTALLAAFAPAGLLHAAKIADVTRLGGHRSNELVGMGLVIGLDGTGDGGDFLPAIRPLAAMLKEFSNTANVLELNDVDNVALVMVRATLPPTGVRNGDRVSVVVSSIGAASSLRGGTLFITPLRGPTPGTPGVFALAQGQVLLEDPTVPTSGVVRGGAVMEADLPAYAVVDGKFTLVIDEPSASYSMASNISKMINDSEDGREWARAVDARVVEVTIPPSERARPDGFIARVQRLPVPLVNAEARVVINDRSGTMIITGDVQISPVIISHKGLTISTVRPQLPPTPANPVVETREFVALDPESRGGAKLQDLINALDALKVPAEDRIQIIKELHESGKLHAKLVVER
ncbi:MAG: flagellar basal body P-ring protein FlgI [Phycisphaerae bacterium]